MDGIATPSKRCKRDVADVAVHGEPLCDGKNLSKTEAHTQQLLPGIPDALTLTNIAPKVNWEAIHNLVSVSITWLGAIKSRCVYKERVLNESTETVFAFQRRYSKCFAFYSMEEDHVYHLPPIPNFPAEALKYCELISLDGKLYVFTGAVTKDIDFGERTIVTRRSSTFVFDLVGRHGWKRLAGMPALRQCFTCGFLDGKIYVFGGLCFNRKTPGYTCDVYDVADNKWSSIKTPRFTTDGRKVVAVGNELIAYGGVIPDGPLHWFMDRWMRPRRANEPYEWRDLYDRSVDIYDSTKDEWKHVEEFTTGRHAILTIGGKLHRISLRGLDVYKESHGWMLVQSFTGSQNDKMNIYSCMVIGDVLLVASERSRQEHRPIVYAGKWTASGIIKPQIRERLRLRADMVLGEWEEVTCFLDKCEMMQLFDCPVQF